MAALPEAFINVVTLDGVKLDLSEGDTLAVMVPRLLSSEQRECLMQALARALPGVKSVIFDGGITIAAISK
jgi:hypothetical protein